jgi:hypothetical protein
MSVFTISNRFLDPLDPFWICRVLALKAGTAAILMFLCNVFLKSPEMPALYMMTALIGVIGSEVLPADSKLKKLSHFMGIVFLLSTTGLIFGLLSYFKFPLFIFYVSFSYLLLRFLVPNAKAAALPILLIIWGSIQLAGGATTNLVGVANEYLYYFEFSLMCIIAIIFFPDYTPYMVKSAFLRILESDIKSIGKKDNKNSSPIVLSALHLIRSKLPSLPDSYQLLYQSIVLFQNECMKNHRLTLDDQQLAKSVLLALTKAICNGKAFPEKNADLIALKSSNESTYLALNRLIDGYDQCQA